MDKKIEVNIGNKSFYSIALVLALLLIATGVYAYSSNFRSGTPSIMGHSLGELQVPGHCANGQYLGIDGSGDWNCFTPSNLPTPPSCTGSDRVLHWSSNSWSCAVISSDSGPSCGWSGWSDPCGSTYCTYIGTGKGVDSDVPSECLSNPMTYFATAEYCSGGTITDSRAVTCCPKTGSGSCLVAPKE